jgi:hypothetical protein
VIAQHRRDEPERGPYFSSGRDAARAAMKMPVGSDSAPHARSRTAVVGGCGTMTRSHRLGLVVLLCFTTFAGHSARAAALGEDGRWWPTQALPKGLVRTRAPTVAPSLRGSFDMMLQSVAGRAAQSTQTGRGDELLWIASDNVDVEDWGARWRRQHPEVEDRGGFEPWALVDRYVGRGYIRGYILYRRDVSPGEINQARRGMDASVNVATTLAGILGGIIVDEALEPEARRHGLVRLFDARDRTAAWCFETYRDRLNPRIACAQDPRKSNARDFAIAHRAFTGFGDNAPNAAVLQWLTPLSPILGWNGGDEFKTTALSSRWGHIQTATDWCSNLTVLSAGAAPSATARVHHLDPRAIDWSDRRSTVSFISTDGDNVQWFEGNFFRSQEGRSYWGNPERGRVPFGWSCCFAQLAQLCPPAVDYAVATQCPNDALIEWGGGYYFPDHFARDRPNRWGLLAAHARRTWALMQQNDTRLIGFNVAKFDSADALQAYRVFAGETDGLLGILVFEYERYEAGAGRVFWVKDRGGRDVPVISARYSLWSHANARARAGTPAKVAREIRQTVENPQPSRPPRHDWVIAHVWSWFKRAPGADENAEDMPQENAAARGGERGYTPVMWCAERLGPSIRVVGPEEMVWRLRMQHAPEETQALIATWR